MILRVLAGLSLGAALLACAPSQTTPDPSAPVSSMAPGQYRTTVTYAAGSAGVDAPVMSTEQCVSTGDITNLVNNTVEAGEGQTCSENTIRTANGRIEGRAVCVEAQGFARTMEVTGTYGNNRADMDLTVSVRSDAGTMSRDGRVVIERVGECS